MYITNVKLRKSPAAALVKFPPDSNTLQELCSFREHLGFTKQGYCPSTESVQSEVRPLD